MLGRAAKIQLSEMQQIILEELSRSRTVAQCFTQRATIILQVAQGWFNGVIAEDVKLNRHQRYSTEDAMMRFFEVGRG